MEISLIVPVYNVEPYLRRCLDSVLAQTFTGFEVILVDDGSTDASGRICDEYAEKDARFRVIHKQNGGVSSARNEGIQASRGRYLAFLDSDDELVPDAFAVFAALPAEYDLAVCGSKWIATDGRTHSRTFSQKAYAALNSQALCEMLREKVVDCVWGKRFRLSTIREHSILFDEKFDLGEDTLFVCRFLACCGNAYISRQTPYRYHQNSGTLSGFDERYVERLCSARNAMRECLRERFPEAVSSPLWEKQTFGVYHYAIACIRQEKRPFRQKYRMLKRIYRQVGFRRYMRSPETYLPNSNPVYRMALSRKSPLWLLLLDKGVKMKNAVHNKRREEGEQ